MVSFDHKNIKILRYIKYHPKNQEQILLKKFRRYISGQLLINMCIDGYLVAEKPDGTYAEFQQKPYHTEGSYRYALTAKGRKILDDRFDRLWQWSIPTLISVAALIISIISAILQSQQCK